MNEFSIYFSLGWEHIMQIGALDHILFIISLAAIYIFQEWKKVLILITAFTIGHSITLVLSTFNLIHPSVKWIEFFIPCTIIITAFTNLFQNFENNSSIKVNYSFALIFGLIHGLGFASGLRSLLGKNDSILTPLFGFNLGIETAQVILVISILMISGFFINILKVPRKNWILFLSAGVFSLALKMAIERWP